MNMRATLEVVVSIWRALTYASCLTSFSCRIGGGLLVLIGPKLLGPEGGRVDGREISESRTKTLVVLCTRET